jgi:hypothetical protein
LPYTVNVPSGAGNSIHFEWHDGLWRWRKTPVLKSSSVTGGNIIAQVTNVVPLTGVLTFDGFVVRMLANTEAQIATLAGTKSVSWLTEQEFPGGSFGNAQGIAGTPLTLTTTFAVIADGATVAGERCVMSLLDRGNNSIYNVTLWRHNPITGNWSGWVEKIGITTSSIITANNGLTMAGNTIQLGTNPLIQNTTIPTNSFQLALTSSTINTPLSISGTINDYQEIRIKNTSTGVQAQSGFTAEADNGTASSGFAWMGINNSAFNFPTTYNAGVAGDVTYVGSGQDLIIANANQTKAIKFQTGKATTPFFDTRMTLLNNGNLGLNTLTPTSTLQVAGSLSLPYVSTATNFTATSSHYTINCNNVAAITVTLPTPVGIIGRIYIVKRDFGSVGSVSITPVAGQIQGLNGTFLSTTTLQALGNYGQSAHFQSDGINWHRIN